MALGHAQPTGAVNDQESIHLFNPVTTETQSYETVDGGSVDKLQDGKESGMSFRMRMMKTCIMASVYVGLVRIVSRQTMNLWELKLQI